MLKRFTDLCRRSAQSAAEQEEALRAIVGDSVMDSKRARVCRKGMTISVIGQAFAPLIAFLLLFTLGAMSAYGYQITPKPFDADSGQLGRTFVAIIKWAFIGLGILSAGGVIITIVNGLGGKDWQRPLIWSIIGFCASGLIVWAMTVGQGKDPAFDTSGLGR